MCRSRRELSNEIDFNSNEYLLAKIGVDTAENEPLEVWGKRIQYYSFVSLITKAEARPSHATQPSATRPRGRLRPLVRQAIQSRDPKNALGKGYLN